METKIGGEKGLVITITKPEMQYIAECKSLEVFGNGTTAIAAICDLAEFMKQDYRTLLVNKGCLSEYLENKLKQYKFGDDD